MSELIRQLPPGPALIDELEARSADLDDATLVDALAAWDRVAAWVESRRYEAVRQVASRLASRDRGEIEHVRMALGLSRIGARNQILVAQRLHTVFGRARALLERGELSRGHIWALVDATRDLDDEHAGRVEDAMISDAPSQTIAELRRALDRAVIASDPRTAEARYDAAIRGRAVERWRDRDGLGGIGARLAAEDLDPSWAAVDALAEQIRQADDPRGRAALRADALVELLTGRPAAHDPRRRPDTPTTPDDSDWLAPTPETTEAPSPPPSMPTTEVQVVMTPADLVAGPAPTAQEDRVVGPPGPRPLSARVRVLAGLAALTGRAQLPAELNGHGSVPASVARRMAGGDVLLRRLVIDPTTGSLLDGELTLPLIRDTTGGEPHLSPAIEALLRHAPLSPTNPEDVHPGYRPPAPLARHIHLRDRTCVVWGCGQPAVYCDIDHSEPHPRGPTCAANCGLLCRWHHRLKTLHGWRLTRTPDGAVWASPTQHCRRRKAYDYRHHVQRE